MTMTKKEKLEACDEVLSLARQVWLDASSELKQERMNKINDLLDRRLKIMQEPENTQP
jgi:hypothetical protein